MALHILLLCHTTKVKWHSIMIFIHAAHCNTEYVYVLATCNSTEKNSAWLTEQKLIIEYDF